MKYIRTKDGRIIDTSNFVVKREIYENGELKFYQFWTTRFADRQVIELFANEVIKQDDTIKELCDEFVVAYEDGARIVYSDLEWAKCKAEASPTKSIIYGAIWTDKGLIYVAKMNEKGELELL